MAHYDPENFGNYSPSWLLSAFREFLNSQGYSQVELTNHYAITYTGRYHSGYSDYDSYSFSCFDSDTVTLTGTNFVYDQSQTTTVRTAYMHQYHIALGVNLVTNTISSWSGSFDWFINYVSLYQMCYGMNSNTPVWSDVNMYTTVNFVNPDDPTYNYGPPLTDIRNIRQGTSIPLDICLGSQSVELYLGAKKVWGLIPEPDWPEWLPIGPREILDPMEQLSPYYVDLAYDVDSALYPFTYYRVFVNPDRACSIEKSSNHYTVFTTPYDSSFRGFSCRTCFYSTVNQEWYFTGQNTNLDRVGTEMYTDHPLLHKAIISSSITDLTNETGESDWDDFR